MVLGVNILFLGSACIIKLGAEVNYRLCSVDVYGGNIITTNKFHTKLKCLSIKPQDNKI